LLSYDERPYISKTGLSSLSLHVYVTASRVPEKSIIKVVSGIVTELEDDRRLENDYEDAGHDCNGGMCMFPIACKLGAIGVNVL
jgi:hypothetical protein